MFVPPLYMLKLFSGVTASGSLATVAGLSILAGGAILLYAILDYLRSLTYQRLSGWLAERLGDVAIAPISALSLSGGERPAELLKDIGLLRDFVSGGALTAGLEIVWAPLFFGALFLCIPYFGWLGLGAGACSPHHGCCERSFDQRTSQTKQSFSAGCLSRDRRRHALRRSY